MPSARWDRRRELLAYVSLAAGAVTLVFGVLYAYHHALHLRSIVVIAAGIITTLAGAAYLTIHLTVKEIINGPMDPHTNTVFLAVVTGSFAAAYVIVLHQTLVTSPPTTHTQLLLPIAGGITLTILIAWTASQLTHHPTTPPPTRTPDDPRQ